MIYNFLKLAGSGFDTSAAYFVLHLKISHSATFQLINLVCFGYDYYWVGQGAIQVLRRGLMLFFWKFDTHPPDLPPTPSLRWVYTSDAVKRRHTMRRFAALAGAFLLASVCASVVVKSINARAYKAWQKLSDSQDTV